MVSCTTQDGAMVVCSMDEHPAGEHLLVMSDETTGSPEVEFMKKTVVFYTIVA